jgi:hypothetical protein
MTPIAEPPGDIRAQLEAAIDREHPKRACFMVPADAANLRDAGDAPGVLIVRRAEGALVTTDPEVAELFRQRADDSTMALILGYPESKDLIIERCPKPVSQRARAVQARDAAGHVVTEAYCSPIMFLRTCEAMARHVPPGGELVVLSPVASIARRIALRWIGH